MSGRKRLRKGRQLCDGSGRTRKKNVHRQGEEEKVIVRKQ